MMLNFDQFQCVTFDCYGTLIDWESGILPVLQTFLNNHNINLPEAEILELFAQFEAHAEHGKYQKYRDVLGQVVADFAGKFDFKITDDERYCLSESIKNWLPFPDTVAALKALKTKYKIGIISNIDDELFRDTAQHLQVEIDFLITASQVKSYKPSIANFQVAHEKMGLKIEEQLHIAQSIYHDIIPAKSLGLKTVWVNRRVGKTGGGATLPAISQPDLEVADLKSLVELMKIRNF
jgi:2-haloacid dehalogenase